MKKIIISTLLSLGIITSLNVSADNTIGMSLGESETIGASSLSKVFGDVNCDGVCNILDTIALKNYLIEGKENQFYNYDINQNGSIDKFDLYNLNQIVTGEVKTLEDIPMYYKITNDEIQKFLVEHRITSLNGREYICFTIIDQDVNLSNLGLTEKECVISWYYKSFYDDDEIKHLSNEQTIYFNDNIENHYYVVIDVDIKKLNKENLARAYISISKCCKNIYYQGIKTF